MKTKMLVNPALFNGDSFAALYGLPQDEIAPVFFLCVDEKGYSLKFPDALPDSPQVEW